MERILVIGGLGQLGSELYSALIDYYSENQVLITDIRQEAAIDGYFSLDATNRELLFDVISENKITQVYHLAAVLSAKGEQNPLASWEINMSTLLNVLEAGRQFGLKIFWPSSIAVFGPDTPKENVPQRTITNPTTVYGLSKLAGEKWCEYYFKKFGVDVRSIRYPGLIGYKGLPGGGTTDYAVEIFHEVLKNRKYTSFIREDSYMPMMYMPDAVRGTLELMHADTAAVKVRTSYNLAAFSFTPAQLADEIRNLIPDIEVTYAPDFRQEIADSWPDSVDDMVARNDWGWKPAFSLSAMVKDMIEHLS